jgi:hypothetical protein
LKKGMHAIEIRYTSSGSGYRIQMAAGQKEFLDLTGLLYTRAK